MAVARLGSRATAKANRIWGGVYIEKGGVHVIVPYKNALKKYAKPL